MFDSTKFQEMLPLMVGRFHYFESIGSSNDMAAEMVREGAGSGALILAEEQTRGRGRGGNAWVSEKGSGLWFSLVLEPDFERELWSRMALGAGVAVAEALQEIGVDAQLKWPNDVWIRGKKCAGILVETCGEAVVIGIGVNVSGHPLSVEATNVIREAGREVSRELLLAKIVQQLMAWCSRCGAGFSGVVEAFNQRSLLQGQMIQLQRGGKQMVGRMLGVDADGYLMLEAEDGAESIAQADQVRLLEL